MRVTSTSFGRHFPVEDLKSAVLPLAWWRLERRGRRAGHSFASFFFFSSGSGDTRPTSLAVVSATRQLHRSYAARNRLSLQLCGALCFLLAASPPCVSLTFIIADPDLRFIFGSHSSRGASVLCVADVSRFLPSEVKTCAEEVINEFLKQDTDYDEDRCYQDCLDICNKIQERVKGKAAAWLWFRPALVWSLGPWRVVATVACGAGVGRSRGEA